MDKILRNKKTIMAFVLPGFLVYIVFFLYPILQSGIYSLTEWRGYTDPVFIGFENYIALFEDKAFRLGLKNILIMLVAVLCIQLPLALLFALLLSRLTKGVRFLKTGFFVPVVFSATAVGLVWLRIYDVKYGLINQFLKSIGSEYVQRWLVEPQNVMLAVSVALIWCKFGYYLIILYAGIKAIPNDYYEASLLDGCSGIKATIHITLPLLRNVTASCAVLCAVGAVKEYPLIYVMTLGGPANYSSTPALLMYKEAFLSDHFGYASAISIMLVIMSLVIYKLVDKLFPSVDIQY